MLGKSLVAQWRYPAAGLRSVNCDHALPTAAAALGHLIESKYSGAQPGSQSERDNSHFHIIQGAQTQNPKTSASVASSSKSLSHDRSDNMNMCLSAVCGSAVERP